MDYFRILNLRKEPFSNSPEPEFFFQSSQHLGCLQKLELAIRLRRGLNVVIGDVGTGKTTLCRQLILQFSGTEEDRLQVETHLILDPAFSTPLEFLASVAVTFGIPLDNASEWQYKENIKKYLFQRGVDEGKIIVLIVDEGQKLPQFCLEILREFLNYETNTNKLLQIVIFAQNEFVQTLREYANFADRINLYYVLKPLNFTETRKLISYRLEKASEGEGRPPLFTYPALVAVYLTTKGYPRKIVAICHHVILTLIIQNRAKAGYFLVLSCARRMTPLRAGKSLRWAVSAALIIIVAVVGSAALAPGWWQMFFSHGIPSHGEESQARQAAIPAVAGKLDQARTDREGSVAAQYGTRRPEAKRVNVGKMPEILGYLTIKRRDTLLGILRNMYGEQGAEKLQAIARLNPQIKNVDFVRAGDTMKIPALPVKSSTGATKGESVTVQVDRAENVDDAYRVLTGYPRYLPPVKLLPYWNRNEGIVFSIVLRERFPDEASTRNVIAMLPSDVAKDVKFIRTWGPGTVFYAD